MPRERITLLVGTGLHRQMSAEELDALLGPEIARGYRVVVHDAKDPDALTFLRRYPASAAAASTSTRPTCRRACGS